MATKAFRNMPNMTAVSNVLKWKNYFLSFPQLGTDPIPYCIRSHQRVLHDTMWYTLSATDTALLLPTTERYVGLLGSNCCSFKPSLIPAVRQVTHALKHLHLIENCSLCASLEKWFPYRASPLPLCKKVMLFCLLMADTQQMLQRQCSSDLEKPEHTRACARSFPLNEAVTFHHNNI